MSLRHLTMEEIRNDATALAEASGAKKRSGLRRGIALRLLTRTAGTGAAQHQAAALSVNLADHVATHRHDRGSVGDVVYSPNG